MYNNYKENNITYQQIVMRQIQIVQEICSKELREGTKIIKNLIGEQTIEGEDTRYSYLQSVEMLGSLLFPYFPKQKNDDNGIITDFENFCELNDLSLIKALEDEEFKKEIKDNFGLKSEDILKEIKDCKITNEVNIYLLNYKIKIARRIFRDLVRLFKDNEFLNLGSYGEGYSSDEGMDAAEEDGE